MRRIHHPRPRYKVLSAHFWKHSDIGRWMRGVRKGEVQLVCSLWVTNRRPRDAAGLVQTVAWCIACGTLATLSGGLFKGMQHSCVSKHVPTSISRRGRMRHRYRRLPQLRLATCALIAAERAGSHPPLNRRPLAEGNTPSQHKLGGNLVLHQSDVDTLIIAAGPATATGLRYHSYLNFTQALGLGLTPFEA